MTLDDRLAELAAAHRRNASLHVNIDAALARTRAVHARQARRQRVVVAAAACVALIVTGIVAVVGLEPRDREDVVAGPRRGAAPPAEPARDDGLRMWVSSPLVPPGTDELAVAIVNTSAGPSPTFGVGAELERWDGTAWAAHRQARLCVDFWLCRGDLASPGDDFEVEDIGIGAPANGIGPMLWLPVSDLAEGSYRLVLRGGRANAEPEHVYLTGRFDVATGEAAQAPPPGRPLESPQLVATPPILGRAGGDVSLSLAGDVSTEFAETFWEALTDPAPDSRPALERWRGGGWSGVASFGGVLPPQDDNRLARRIVLPPLVPGAYRLVAGGAEARVWIEDLFGPTTVPATLAPGALEELDAGPLAPRTEAAMAVVDDKLFVWGGSIEGPNVGRPDLGFKNYDDGAAYDLETGRWTLLPPAPILATPAPRAAAFAGGVAVFSGRQTATWAPTRKQWTALPDAPVRVVDAVALDDGVFVLGDDDEGAGFLSADDRREWKALPRPPRGRDSAIVATGEEVIAVGPSGGARWGPGDDDWRSLPEFELGRGERSIEAAWTGDRVVIVGYGMGVAAIEPVAARWTRLASMPVRFYEGGPSVFAVDGAVVVYRPPALAVLAPDGWTTLPDPVPGALRDSVVARDSLYAFGFSSGGGNRFVRLRPRVAATDPPVVQIGAARLPLASGDRVERTEATMRDDQVDGLILTITTPSGSCKVSATFNIGELETPPTQQSDGAWAGVIAGDRVLVRCEQPAEAERIAMSVRPPTPTE